MTTRDPILEYQCAQLERLLEVLFDGSGVELLRFDGNLFLRMADRDAFLFRYHVRGFAAPERVFAPTRRNPITGEMQRNNVMNGYGERIIACEDLRPTKDLTVVANRAWARAHKRYRKRPFGGQE